MQAQHFHAILKGGGNGVQHVGRGHEEHLGQIVFHVQVMVLEHPVLLGVKDFQERRGGIAAEIRGHLVDFIEHEDRVLGAGLLHHLDDLAGQGADISPAVAANLGFIAHAAQRHADKLAPGGLGDVVAVDQAFVEQHRMEPLGFFTSWRTARNSRMRSLIFSRP